MKDSFEFTGRINKVDTDRRLVFGFFNIVKVGENVVTDSQNDQIEVDDLEKSAYDFVLNSRNAGEWHVRTGVGQLVESLLITKEKQDAMQKTLREMGVEATIDFGCECWWGGFYVEDDEVWKAVKDGDYEMFSIGGTGKRVELEG